MVLVILAKIQFILGIINIIAILIVGLSCRCVLGKYAFLSTNEKFMKFYKYHCFYWWLFIFSVLGHVILAFIVYGIPF